MIWYITMHLTSLVFLCSSAFSCILLSLMSLYYNSVTMNEWEIMTLNSSSVVMTLIFDWISFMFLGFVLFISSMVLFYSGDYMEGDKSFNRFM